MTWVRIGNLIEGGFWLLVSLFFLVPAIKPREGHRLFCLVGFILFALFGVSDFYEARSGAWWRPWWLLVWKIGCNFGFFMLLVWYIRIHGSFKKVIETLRKPIRFK